MFLIVSIFAYSAEITISVVDQKSNAVTDGYVELYALSGQEKSTPGSGEVDQVDKEFTPLYSAVAVGSTVLFPNSDNIQHQIYSFSKSKKFDLPLFAKNDQKKVTFDKAGIIHMGCNIHDWMLSFFCMYMNQNSLDKPTQMDRSLFLPYRMENMSYEYGVRDSRTTAPS